MLLGDTDLGVLMRNLTFPYILCGMIVSALSEAILSHLETPNRVNVEFWGGVNAIWKYGVTLVGVPGSNTGKVEFFGVSFL